jgi:glycosyltransferase involved in cell wall biosynthesis
MALGKPVVCYIRPSWKEFFLKTFPEYKDLPIVEADTNTIYDALKKLVTDPDYRRRKGEESRKFSKAHFDPEKNTRDFVKILNAVLKQN